MVGGHRMLTSVLESSGYCLYHQLRHSKNLPSAYIMHLYVLQDSQYNSDYLPISLHLNYFL